MKSLPVVDNIQTEGIVSQIFYVYPRLDFKMKKEKG